MNIFKFLKTRRSVDEVRPVRIPRANPASPGGDGDESLDDVYRMLDKQTVDEDGEETEGRPMAAPAPKMATG